MIVTDLSVLMWLTLVLAAGAIVAYAHPRVPLELTSATLVALLLVLFGIVVPADGERLLDAAELLRGFANPALIAIVALLVIGQGLVRAGALEVVTRTIYQVSGGKPGPAIILALAAALVISAVLNNTPVVVIFIPIIGALAERLDRPASRILMLLSYSAILGGMTTLIGSSTNLLVAGTAAELGAAPIGFFDFTVPGLVLAAIGFLYVIFVAPHLLRHHQPERTDRMGLGGRQFVAQFNIDADSALVGVSAVAGMFPVFRNMTVLLIERGGVAIRPPFEDVTLSVGDTVIVAATRKVLTDALAPASGLTPRFAADAERAADKGDDEPRERLARAEVMVAEAMVAPGSRLAGLPIEQIAFPTSHRTTVVGVQRRARMTRANMREVRLEAGDLLLVHGQSDDVRSLRINRDVILMERSAAALPSYHHARRTVLIFLAVVGLAASGVLPIAITAVAGAALMVIVGALNVRQAARAIDRQIIMVGGAALALNAALTATGGAAYIANGLVDALDGAGVIAMLSAFFLLVAVLTNVLSNNACAVLFTPIGISIAQGLGIDPMVFIVAVILAANCSFASPIGYVTNLLVMAPGRYRFTDFVRAGSPLIIVLWIAFSLFAPWYYGLW